jgi:hypothetical protein
MVRPVEAVALRRSVALQDLPDAIGELADVACPDGWILTTAAAAHRGHRGQRDRQRTAAGSELIAAATMPVPRAPR